MPEIRFTYQPPTAGSHEVGIAGDFSSWVILDLIDVGGIYILPLHLENGKYRYKFIVDGFWITDPLNPVMEPDPFGGNNSILTIHQEHAPQFTWEEVWQDLSLLRDRIGNYLILNRLSEGEYELRLNWYPCLQSEISLLIEDVEQPLYRLGVSHLRDVYHCQFVTSHPTAKILIRITHNERSLYLGAEGFTLLPEANRPWNLKLTDIPIFAVPSWVSRGIIYQIFPDRFYNGDPALNPDFSEWYYADCRTPPPEGEYLPPQIEHYHFVEDWSDVSGLSQSPWREPGKPDWWSFYGGDLPGVMQKLDYLQELGVTILYFNPLWQAKSNHKYDAADFRKIDPHFGSTADMQALVASAHSRGMHIIVDVAFNHTGESFWAFRDCVEKGSSSEYWNWYDWKNWPLPKPLPADFHPKDYYQCWWGIKDMPDLNFDLDRTHPSENYIKDIAKAVPNENLVAHLMDCVQWWLLEIGIDGFRLDVPDEVPYWFWQLFREKVKALKPDAWIVGEIWQSAQGWVGSRYFDSVMNYAHFKNPVLEFFILGLINKTAFCASVEEGLAQYPIQALRAMMNLLGSHDTHRIRQLAQGNMPKLKLALLFQMTFIGTPHIYYGDEIAMCGGKDPDNRRPFNWNWEQDAAAVDLRECYLALINLRRSHPLFWNSEFCFVPSADGLLVYQRYTAKERICIAMNYSTTPIFFATPTEANLLFVLGEATFQSEGFLLSTSSAIVYSCL